MMKKRLKLAYLIFFCTTLVWAQENQTLLGETIPCEEIDLPWLSTVKNRGEHIIRDSAEYQAILQGPYLDFDSHTLIGYISTIGGCNFPEIAHEIRRINDHYTVNIIITQHGLCKRNNPVRLWCLIPKVDENSIVEFDIETVKKSN